VTDAVRTPDERLEGLPDFAGSDGLVARAQHRPASGPCRASTAPRKDPKEDVVFVGRAIG